MRKRARVTNPPLGVINGRLQPGTTDRSVCTEHVHATHSIRTQMKRVARLNTFWRSQAMLQRVAPPLFCQNDVYFLFFNVLRFFVFVKAYVYYKQNSPRKSRLYIIRLTNILSRRSALIKLNKHSMQNYKKAKLIWTPNQIIYNYQPYAAGCMAFEKTS